MNTNQFRLRPILLTLGLALASMQSNAQTNMSQPENDSQKELERIIVEGDEQISVLRYNFYRAEEDFFNLFNELIDNESFRISCKQKERHAFTRIKQRSCESKFQDEEEYRMTQRAIQTGSRRYDGTERNAGHWMSRLPLQGEVYTQQKRLQKKQIAAMEALIVENPELQQKLIKLNEAKQKFEDAKQQSE